MQGDHHTMHQFDVELEAVRAKVLQMGGLVEQQIVQAIEALTTGDMGLADRVVDEDHTVNALEISIDDDCSRVIARRQPAAGDLRMLIAVVKTITDLERIGDEAAKIARMAKLIHSSDRLHTPRIHDIQFLVNIALDMLRKALDSFARLDAAAAAQVVRQDVEVDDAFLGILRQLITFMMEDPRTISAALQILFTAKAIERIGDHAKNMAEYVIYLVKGKDVRHVTVEEMEREAMQ